MTGRILVPHDGTEMSDRALARATEFAKALGAEMVIVHIVDSRFVPPSATLGFISDRTSLEAAKAELVRILKSGAEQMLKKRLEEVRKKGVKVDFVLGVGSPADEIVKTARNVKADTIVIGSRQLKGADKLKALGSVARKVSETADCPVMIIR
ncbi:MAG: universal stress protein [Nitrososphaera sp.]|uniref:universal stress protein n=1 Tax=Nitrososphaera sp. TaxID=1971748 RepID=UPI0018404DFE|nr:universal stress protein [Nitrososphaera sp.]NWG36825.1 universal stress protein [Nitrososphaera sp.]